ncbi:hypothetical protein L196_11443, partial [Cycloclasticus pugetii]
CADRLGLAPQDIALALAAPDLEIRVESFPTAKARDGNHEVPPGISHEPFGVALVIAFARPPVAIAKQVVRLQPTEQRGAPTCPVRQDLRDQAAIIVIEHRQRHASEESE